MSFTPDEAKTVGEDIGIDWNDVEFDPEDLAMGMEVELEHGSKLDERVNVTDDNLDATAQIAWAHLMEDPDYYLHLDEMEQQLDGERTPELRKEAVVMQQVRFGNHLYRIADQHTALSSEGYARAVERANAAACRDGILGAVKAIHTRVKRTQSINKLDGIERLVNELYNELVQIKKLLPGKW